ncbi:MAG: type II toxin-antitoxin system VapC family toxin [Sulfolobales archaeon]
MKTIIEAVKSVIDLDIVYECDIEVWRIAIELSFKIDISVYDAVYAALSVSRKAPLVTSDRELHNKLKGHMSIILLEEL